MALPEYLRILRMLKINPESGEGDLGVLTERTGLHRAAVSRYLHELEEAGLARALDCPDGTPIPWASTELGLQVARLLAKRS